MTLENEEKHKKYGQIGQRVWTKGAHGGAYKISTGPGASLGYDALEQKPDGTNKEVDAGYEKPDTGATTNFVGNHMTQGAIDLVQNELTRADPDLHNRRARLDCARGVIRTPPQRVTEPALLLNAASEETTSAKKIKRSVETYAWRDDGDVARVDVRGRDVRGGDVSRAALTSPSLAGDDPRRFTLEIPPAVDRGTGTVKGETWVLTMRLANDVDAENCVVRVDGDVARVILAKPRHRRGPWTSLRAPEDVDRAKIGDARDEDANRAPPDLAALRRQLIKQREGKLAVKLPWFHAKSLPAPADDVMAIEDASINTLDTSVILNAEEAHDAGEACATRGEHADASRWFTRALDLYGERSENERSRATTHAARARALTQIGSLRDAIDDYSSAAELLDAIGATDGDDSHPPPATGSEQTRTELRALDVVLARGRCKLALEDAAGAAGDFRAVVERARRGSSVVIAASEALRDAMKMQHVQKEAKEKEAEMRERCGDFGGDGFPGFARPGMRQFDNRGKSGTAF